jgi:hypothetical protein
VTLRRPDKRAVAAYRAALEKFRGVPPVEVWRRYSLRTRTAAIWLYRNGRQAPLEELPETPAARRRPKAGDL